MSAKENDKSKLNDDCFIIMPISDPAGYDTGHFKGIYDDIFKPACEVAGLNPIRADDIESTSMIHINILQKLLNSPMAICDLSSHNPNVLFELGVRQAFDMPTVLVQEEGTTQIFDIAPLNYCTYRKKRLYKEVIEDQKKLAQYLKNTSEALKNGDIINSIVKLLNVNKAVMKEDTGDSASIVYNYILAEINQLKNEIIKSNTSSAQSYFNDENYGRILSALKQLAEIVRNGTPDVIFNKNYNNIFNQISTITDSEIRTMLLDNLETIKKEHEMFL